MKTSKPSLPPLERGLELLEFIASNPNGVTWKEAHEKLGSVSTATVTRILQVLTKKEYLVHKDGLYLCGSRCEKLALYSTPLDIIKRKGQNWAKLVAEAIQESVVIAQLQENKFIFTGVHLIDESISCSGIGTVIPYSFGHALTLLLHAGQNRNKLKDEFDKKKFDFGNIGKPPAWRSFVDAIEKGRKSGMFFADEFRRKNVHRVTVPIFDQSGKIIGGCMASASSPARIKECAGIVFDMVKGFHSELPGGCDSFCDGLDLLQKS